MNESTKKKYSQLGMDPGTASNKLVKDLLFKFAVSAGHRCFRCGEELTRETLSIEHKVAWLDSEDPYSLFFDLDNVAFSHLKCNVKASRGRSKPCSESLSAKKNCKCELCVYKRTIKRRENTVYCPIARSARYRRTGN